MPKLYVVGIGPGDPELLTLKAKRILEEVAYLFFPKGREGGASLARSIVEPVVDLSKKHIEELYFPMAKRGDKGAEEELKEKWNIAAEKLVKVLKEGNDVAFLTLGDPGIYSTFFNLVPYLNKKLPDIDLEIIPGISSINLAFSKLKVPIVQGEEAFVVLPATYSKDIQKILNEFSTVILMKVHMVFNKCLDLIKRSKNLETYYVSKLGMKDEIIIKDIEKVNKEDLNYFSMILTKRRTNE